MKIRVLSRDIHHSGSVAIRLDGELDRDALRRVRGGQYYQSVGIDPQVANLMQNSVSRVNPMHNFIRQMSSWSSSILPATTTSRG
jgi:hypothetical protein